MRCRKKWEWSQEPLWKVLISIPLAPEKWFYTADCAQAVYIAHRLECNMARSAHPEINYPFSFSQKQFPIVARSTGQGCTHTLKHTHDFSMHMFWKEEEWVKKCALFSAVQSTPPHDPLCLHSTHRAIYFLGISFLLILLPLYPGSIFLFELRKKNTSRFHSWRRRRRRKAADIQKIQVVEVKLQY